VYLKFIRRDLLILVTTQYKFETNRSSLLLIVSYDWAEAKRQRNRQTQLLLYIKGSPLRIRPQRRLETLQIRRSQVFFKSFALNMVFKYFFFYLAKKERYLKLQGIINVRKQVNDFIWKVCTVKTLLSNKS